VKFDYPPCSCGCHEDLAWSEFKEHIWCPVCEKDYIPEYQGIFDGPIPVGVATMLGISFDRYDLVNEKILRFDPEKCEYLES